MATTWSVDCGKFRQTKHFVPASDWDEYRSYLDAEKRAGRVFGYTTLPHPRGVSVIATHKAEGRNG